MTVTHAQGAEQRNSVVFQARFYNLESIDNPIQLDDDLVLRPPGESDFPPVVAFFARDLRTGRDNPLPFFGQSVLADGPVVEGTIFCDFHFAGPVIDAPWKPIIEALEWALLIEGDAYARFDNVRFKILAPGIPDVPRGIVQHVAHPSSEWVGPGLRITPLIAARLPNTFQRMLAKETRSPAIIVACKRLARAVWTGDPGDEMLMDCCIGLEALYLPGGQAERVEATLSNTLAYYLGDNEADRDRLRSAVDAIYESRSYIAHGQRGKSRKMSEASHQAMQSAVPEHALEALNLLRQTLRLMVRESLEQVDG
jgi:hypothetical protein